jgi:hypothetical protein
LSHCTIWTSVMDSPTLGTTSSMAMNAPVRQSVVPAK